MRLSLIEIAAAAWAITLPVQAADLPVGRDKVLSLAGCYDVTYRFYGDGEHDHFSDAYGLNTSIKELITIVDDELERLTLQHFSINDEGEVVPHWHEVWRYDDPGWRQTVYSSTPDDGARQQRYTCTAPWSLSRWQCRAGRAVKPFRDDGAPFGFLHTDSDWLDRENILLVTPGGWIHSENNRRLDKDGRLVSYGLGFIMYAKLDEAACEASAREARLKAE